MRKKASGTARVLGYDITSEIVKAKKGFGVVPELSNMYDELTGLENLIFMGQLYGVAQRERQSRAEELLRTFGLYERRDSRFATYSRGMKRALTIVAALVHKPNLPRFLMVFLCGVFTPISTLPTVLKQFAYILPLTYTVDGVRQSFGGAGDIAITIDIMVLMALIPALILPAARLLARRFT